MSSMTEVYLTCLEMELAGLLRRVIRPDGQEGWEPVVSDDWEADEKRLETYLGEYDEEPERPLDDEGLDPESDWD